MARRRTTVATTAAAALISTSLVAAGSQAQSPSGGSPALPAATADIATPEEYFGFEMGAEGRLAAYPDVLDYLRTVAEQSDRVEYETVGKTTEGNEYATVFISSPENLERLDEIVELNQRLSDPRSTSPEEAKELAAQSVPIYHLEATVHSTEVGNGQAINDIVHRLATESSDFTEEVLTRSVIMLVPSQNPDGQVKVVDHFDRTAGTDLARVYPDLYQKYTGHDDNRDWTMFTQVEARYRLGLTQKYRPVMTHIMHQQGNTGERIFVPPYGGVTSPNVPANSNASSSAVGQHAMRDLTAEGKKGVGTDDYHVFWTLEQPVGFFPFTGTGVYLTEIASATDLAYPQTSKDGGPLGPQTPTQDLVQPYDEDTWTLRDIVEYAETATYSGMEYVAQNGTDLLYDNLYAAPREFAENGVASGVEAYLVDADQRDPYATYEMLERLDWTQVEIDRATEAFTAGGRDFPAGSWVVRTRQPLGNWADQLLGTDEYPVDDLPYAEATTSLPLQLGVDVVPVTDPVDVATDRVESVEVPEVEMPAAPSADGAYLVRPESYGTIPVVAALQQANITTFRAGQEFADAGTTYPAGTYVVPATPQARRVLATASADVGLPVAATESAPAVEGIQLKPRTRVGLLRGANNMPGGWDMWVMDEYGVDYDVVGAQDFRSGRLIDVYDTIVVPQGISKDDVVEGLDPARYDEEFAWAYGVGAKGWRKLAQFVRQGGTLLAIGDSVATAQELLDLPIEPALPDDEEEFATGGSLLNQEFDASDMVAWGMPEQWPVWLYDTQAWTPTGPGADVVSTYPDRDVLASGYLRGEEHVQGAANVVSFDVGKGTVVTYGSEVTFRSLPRSSFTLLYNAVYGGPAAEVGATQLAGLRPAFAADGTLRAR
ncbi:M14 family zinc carboxypeptidase [Krasilnikoviella flava]|uniref:Zinc carboxypeptidase n=1 Tax=Krasilnikoviella flava TaxID=526729 RepID=A0A1T5KZB6_9MICO|nr:M14 family zinc carboxypeptidase [Krasilnikoviella flava]SKC69051.1 Zinc carboxypeptidase [Krasilnikoviella flava]